MPRVLVTGSRGFTGRYLCARLRERGFDVVGLVMGPVEDRAQEVCCDLSDCVAVAETVAAVRPDHLVHLAAISFVPHADQEAMYRVNLFGTLNLLEAFAAAGLPPRRVVIASSANVYGNPQAERVDETLCPAPVNHYAASKLAMEHMARTWSDRLPLVITRPFNYTGPGQDERFLLPKIVAHFRARKAAISLGNLDVVRDFSDVGDVVEAYVRLLTGVTVAQTVNICSGIGYSLSEILDLSAELAGYRIDVKVDPALVRANELKRLVGDNAKLERLTGFVPRTPLKQTLADMLAAGA